MEESYTIGDLVKELNINKETVRYYEKTGLLSEPKKNKNGYRIYTNKDIEIIRFILIAKNLGFTLKEISILLHDEILSGSIKDIKRVVEHKINDINGKMNELVHRKNLLEKVSNTLLSNNIDSCNNIELYLKNKP
jgi:MerR family Zn(II)-responsive transcriptional regulator of zntA